MELPEPTDEERQELCNILDGFGVDIKDIRDRDLIILWKGGYSSRRRLQNATSEGLTRAGVCPGLVDDILSQKAHAERRHGEPAGGSGGGLATPVAVRCVQRFHRLMGAEPHILDPEEVEYLISIPPGFQLTEAGEPRAVYQRHGDETVRKQGVQLADLRQGWCTVRGPLYAGDVTAVQGATLSSFLDNTKLERLNLGRLAGDPAALPQCLCNMLLAACIGEEVVLTVAGLLLLSKVDNWQRMLGCPSYSIQIQVFNNDDLPGTYLNHYSTDIYSSEEIVGDALLQVDQTMQCITTLTKQMYEKRVIMDEEGRPIVRGFEHTLYPFKAIQELIVNAVVHRSYRQTTGKIVVKVRRRSLEIVVPGDFLPGITASNIGTTAACSLSRNPVLSNFMHDIQRIGLPGKVFEGHGLGVARARQALEASGGTLKYRSETTGAVTVMVTAAPIAQSSPGSG